MKLDCKGCAGESWYHKVSCPRREEAEQLKEMVKFPKDQSGAKKVVKFSTPSGAPKSAGETGASSSAGMNPALIPVPLSEDDMMDRKAERQEDEDPGGTSPSKKARVEEHMVGNKSVVHMATNEEKELYIECDGT